MVNKKRYAFSSQIDGDRIIHLLQVLFLLTLSPTDTQCLSFTIFSNIILDLFFHVRQELFCAAEVR